MEWLDQTLMHDLNPKKNNVGNLTPEQSEAIRKEFEGRLVNIRIQLNAQVFELRSRRKITTLVQNYHFALTALLDMAVQNLGNPEFERGDLNGTMQEVITGLDEMLTFLDKHFPSYLSSKNRVPATYLAIARKKLQARLDRIRESAASDSGQLPAAEIVFKNLSSFLNSKRGSRATFRELYYRKGLIKELEIFFKGAQHDASGLDDLLIYMNFNSRSYLKFYTGCIAEKVNSIDGAGEKIENLSYHFKEFLQKQIRKGVILNPRRKKLSTLLGKWFRSEVRYLENSLRLRVLPMGTGPGEDEAASINAKPLKVLCRLSADQIAIIIRAADESRLLIAKSMTEVFKSIVPHLSTQHKDDLSYDSIRSKSYAAEDRDKEIAIEALEKIIRKVRSY